MKQTRQFIAFFHFVSWAHFSLGIHIDFSSPNIEIHMPIGFIRLGWNKTSGRIPINHHSTTWRDHGIVVTYNEEKKHVGWTATGTGGPIDEALEQIWAAKPK